MKFIGPIPPKGTKLYVTPPAPQATIPEGMLDRIEAAQQRIKDGLCPRRIPADPTDVDLVLSEVRMHLTGQGSPFWVKAAPTLEEGEG